MNQRIVIDTNVYISRYLRPTSIPGRAVEQAFKSAVTLVSTATLFELRGVLNRPKFDRYVDKEAAKPFFALVWNNAQHITVQTKISACRHPTDDKFLELAVDGKADLILTGDLDLLTLHPFRGIAIVTPTQYLAKD